MPRDVMDSEATAEGGGFGVRAGGPRAAASSGMSGNWTVAATRWVAVPGFRCSGRSVDWLSSPVAATHRSDVLRRDDILADRHDAIHRDGLPSRVREVA